MKRILTTSAALFVFVLAALGCEEEPPGIVDPPIQDAIEGDAVSLEVISATSTGEFEANVMALVDADGSLKLISSGHDFDGDGVVGLARLGALSVQVGEDGPELVGSPEEDAQLRCRWRRVGEDGAQDPVDIGVCLDTTSSMGGAAPVLANRIADFAADLGLGGVDARFAGLTHGDAFATRSTTESLFEDPLSSGDVDLDGGDNDPPEWDPDERPGTGTALLGSAEMATFFREVARVYPEGVGGGDVPENYLGCLQWMLESVQWRPGAPMILLSVGDACSHLALTFGEMGLGAAQFWPPGFLEAIDLFVGNATIHVVNRPNLGECSGGYFNMTAAATGTQGTFTNIGDCSTEESCNVDLTTLPIFDAIVNAFVLDCEAREAVLGPSGELTFTVEVEVEDSGSTHVAQSEMVLQVAFAEP